MTTTAIGLRNIEAWMNTRYIDRAELNECLTYGMLTGHNVSVYGPPGTSKSAMAHDYAAALGLTYFHAQLHEFVGENDLFGAIDRAAYQKDSSWQHKIDGYAPTASLILWDEVDKAGPAVINQLLTAWNEKRYRHGDTWIDMPALLQIGTRNANLNDPTGAATDRWLINVEVGYVADGNKFRDLLLVEHDRAPEDLKVGPTEILTAQREVRGVALSDNTLDAIVNLRHALRNEGVTLSDRRWRQSMALVQASAYLDGRDKAVIEDMSPLVHTLWLSPDARKVVQREVLAIANPHAAELLNIGSILDDATTKTAGMDGGSKTDNMRTVVEIRGELEKYNRRLKEMSAGSSGKTHQLASEMQARLAEVYVKLMVAAGLSRSEVSARATAEAELG